MVKKIEKGEDEVKSSTPELKLKYTIETANGKYELKRPMGRVGIRHFTIVTSAIPQSKERDDDGNIITSPGDTMRFNTALDNWTEKVLPEIFISGPFGINEMPGEDIYALFLAMFTTINFSGSDLFRFVE